MHNYHIFQVVPLLNRKMAFAFRCVGNMLPTHVGNQEHFWENVYKYVQEAQNYSR